jgi:hypothetical protein
MFLRYNEPVHDPVHGLMAEHVSETNTAKRHPSGLLAITLQMLDLESTISEWSWSLERPSAEKEKVHIPRGRRKSVTPNIRFTLL